jgi:hypothetical protein
VIVDPEVELAVGLGALDQQCRGLLAALVAAGRFAGQHRRQQALGQRQAGADQVGLKRRLQDDLARQHVAGDGHPVQSDVAAPADAVLTGMRGGAAQCVERVHLPPFPAIVAGDSGGDRLCRRGSALQPFQNDRAAERIDLRLARGDADPGAGPRTDPADGEEAAGNGDAEAVRFRLADDDRPGHGVTSRW